METSGMALWRARTVSGRWSAEDVLSVGVGTAKGGEKENSLNMMSGRR